MHLPTFHHAPTGEISFSAGHLEVGLRADGRLVHLRDRRNGRELMTPGHEPCLVSFMVDGRRFRPTSLTPVDGSTLRFGVEDIDATVDVRLECRADYTTAEVVGIGVGAGRDLQAVLWGPLPLTLAETIGEAVGVVQDEICAVGLRTVNDRTEGSWPRELTVAVGEAGDGDASVEENPYRLQVGIHEQWSIAARTAEGSVLRAFTIDCTRPRARLTHVPLDAEGVMTRVGVHPLTVGPLPAEEGTVIGSKIALFGAVPDVVLTVLGAIARDEDRPRPTLAGQWVKASQRASRSFLVLTDLSTGTLDRAVELTRDAGLEYVYALQGAVGPWATTGTYGFDVTFGGSDEAARELVDRARERGVAVGVHTISDFISPDDPYARDPRLATASRARLARDLTEEDTTLLLDAEAPVRPGLTGTLLRIGEELISYTATRTTAAGVEVSGLARGRWGSRPVAAENGTEVVRMVQNGYGGGVGGLGIIDEIAERLATIWRTTGIAASSFDGLESAGDSGWGSFGMARLVNGVHAGTPGEHIVETSRVPSSVWEAVTRASWGEVGVTSWEQVQWNNDFYAANHLPGMLGWISLDGEESLQSLETKLARGAGLNAGTGFLTSVANLESGARTSELLEAIEAWETARNAGAFTAAQRARLRDLDTMWHLSTVEKGRTWMLQQLHADGSALGAPHRIQAPTPEILTESLPPASLGHLYQTRLISSVPTTVRWSLTAGSLPDGLRLDPDTGGITGVPAQPGRWRLTVTAHDDAGPEAQRQLMLLVGQST